MPKTVKRRKTRLRPKPILVAAIALNLYLGLSYSRLTSVRHVRVEGAEPYDQSRIEAEIQSVRDVPSVQTNPNALESRILSNPAVRSATLSRNIFGGGLLRIAYRQPVARFARSRRLALSDEGVVYAANQLDPKLPTIDVPGSDTEPSLTLVGYWEPQRIAFIASQIKDIDVNQQRRILITQLGRVILYIGQGQVVLGNCDNLDRKFRALHDRLARNSSELSQIAELDLTSPEHPAVVPKTGVGGP